MIRPGSETSYLTLSQQASDRDNANTHIGRGSTLSVRRLGASGAREGAASEHISVEGLYPYKSRDTRTVTWIRGAQLSPRIFSLGVLCEGTISERQYECAHWSATDLEAMAESAA